MLYHYVIVRADLPFGVILAQTVHAAGESGPAISGTYAVVLSVPDESALLALSNRLTEANVFHHLIREPDAPYNGAAMTLGVPPGSRDNLRKHFKKLALFK